MFHPKYYLLLLLLIACSKEEMICVDFKEALVTKDSQAIHPILRDIQRGMRPSESFTRWGVEEGTPLTHADMLWAFVDEINSTCGNVEAEVDCYGCLNNFPANQDIDIHLDSSGVSIVRTIGMQFSSETRMEFSGVIK